ncbi:MAG: aspartate/glutamate racemase family protein [Alphaproteobacteria bacterium]|nr:aspartate/glutamate racemase family protein [Alphaproteobacteria bacterium]
MTRDGIEGFLGILMLATRFPRIPGDIGNPQSHPFPVRYTVVDTATVDAVVTANGLSETVVADFIAAAQAFEHEGARAVTTSCGFLAAAQDRLRDALSIPVLASSLCFYPAVRRRHPSGPIGILTANGAALGESVLAGAGIDPGSILIEGMENCPAFADSILADAPGPLDSAGIADGVTAAAGRLRERAPDLAAVLVECTNLPPYRQKIEAAVGVPVYDVLDLCAALMGESDLLKAG